MIRIVKSDGTRLKIRKNGASYIVRLFNSIYKEIMSLFKSRVLANVGTFEAENYLEEKYQSLQQHIYENSPVISKVRQLKERTALSPKIPSFSERDWTELLRLQENVYGLVSKLKEISPKLTEEDLRVCAFLREGVQPTCFADLMKLTVETLTRRISRIKTEKLMLANSKESLEDIVKSL